MDNYQTIDNYMLISSLSTINSRILTILICIIVKYVRLGILLAISRPQDIPSFSNPQDVLELNAVESDISKTGSSNDSFSNSDYIDCFNVK